jgi:cytochrome c556
MELSRMHRVIFMPALAICLALAGAAMPVSALAEPTAEDSKDYRIAIMTAMRGHIAAVSMQLRGLVEDHGFLAEHAKALASTAAELSHVFPPGSNVGESEALPAIWEQPEAFADAVAEAERATAAFSEAAASGDRAATSAAFREVGAACRGCHDDFRKDDD